MEFVKVSFPSPRKVFIDGEEEGAVGDLIRVQRGIHTFDLGSPPEVKQTPTVTVQAR